MNLLCDMAICQLDCQQYNSDPSLSILEFCVDPSFGWTFSYSHAYPIVIRWLVMILLKRMPACVAELLKVAFDPPQNGNRKLSVMTTKRQSKTVSDIELQNFIPHKESHHFVFCYRKVAWQRVEYAQVLRIMAHLKFKFEVVNENLTF